MFHWNLQCRLAKIATWHDKRTFLIAIEFFSLLTERDPSMKLFKHKITSITCREVSPIYTWMTAGMALIVMSGYGFFPSEVLKAAPEIEYFLLSGLLAATVCISGAIAIDCGRGLAKSRLASYIGAVAILALIASMLFNSESGFARILGLHAYAWIIAAVVNFCVHFYLTRRELREYDETTSAFDSAA